MRYVYKTSYDQDIALAARPGQRALYGSLLVLLAAAPWLLSSYALAQITFIYIYGIVGLGLMLLCGYTGLFSIGHAAFLGIGAYTEAYLAGRGWPLPLSLLASALLAAATGVVVGLPALRVKGIYLAIATLAFGFIVEEVIARAEGVTGGSAGKTVAPLQTFGLPGDQETQLYFVCLALAVLATLFVLNLLRSPVGRAFIAIRDSEISAQSMGIELAYHKSLSFAVSAALTGIGGALYAHKLHFISPEQFSIVQSIDLLIMIVIGGLGSVHGAFLGAMFLIAMPPAIGSVQALLPEALARTTGLQAFVYGAILVVFVLFEPMGLYGRWLKIRLWLESFPLYRAGTFRRQKTFVRSERVR
jgi:branched-chain amino acid transport system permease protein